MADLSERAIVLLAWFGENLRAKGHARLSAQEIGVPDAILEGWGDELRNLERLGLITSEHDQSRSVPGVFRLTVEGWGTLADLARED